MCESLAPLPILRRPRKEPFSRGGEEGRGEEGPLVSIIILSTVKAPPASPRANEGISDTQRGFGEAVKIILLGVVRLVVAVGPEREPGEQKEGETKGKKRERADGAVGNVSIDEFIAGLRMGRAARRACLSSSSNGGRVEWRRGGKGICRRREKIAAILSRTRKDGRGDEKPEKGGGWKGALSLAIHH